jgi:RNA polymerase sigma-70 factor (ECF subfamily)
MKPVPGTLSGGGAPFQTTHWTVVLLANKTDADEAARKALATVGEAYGPPLHTFVLRRGYSSADAQDILQGFFVHLSGQKTLSRAEREKGRLRTFLPGSSQKFLLKQQERSAAIKRGGAHQFVSCDLLLPETEAAMNTTTHLNEVSRCDLTWALTIAKRPWQQLRETPHPNDLT